MIISDIMKQKALLPVDSNPTEPTCTSAGRKVIEGINHPIENMLYQVISSVYSRNGVIVIE